MRLGVTADIRGNLPAFGTVLGALQTDHTVDTIVCLGDILGALDRA
jgi:predicted phosphodiesterase